MRGRQSRRSMLSWRTSKVSADVGQCVEIATEDRTVLVRDSRNPGGTILEFSPRQWSSFVRCVRDDNGISVER